MTGRRRGKVPVFELVWAGQLLSRVGSGMSAFAVGLHLYRHSGSAVSYSLLLLCAFLPTVLLAPVGGVMADRHNRRTLMIVADIGAALGVALVILMLALRAPDCCLYLGVTISSVFAAFHTPAFKAAVTEMVEEAHYSQAGGMIQLAEASRHLISPLAAGYLLASTGLEVILALDLLTFLVAALCVVAVRFEVVARPDGVVAMSPFGEFKAAISHIRANQLVVSLLKLGFVTTFFAGVLQALFAPLVLGYTDGKTLGLVLSTGAVGMVASSLFISSCRRLHDQRSVLGTALVVAALFYCLIGLSPGVPYVTAASLIFFISLPFINTALEVLLRTEVAGTVQGKVWSAVSLVTQSGMIIAYLVSGFLSDQLAARFPRNNPALPYWLGKISGHIPLGGPSLVIVSVGIIFLLFALHFKIAGSLSLKRRSETLVASSP